MRQKLTEKKLNAAWKKTRVDVPLSFDPPQKATKEDIKGEMPKNQSDLFKDIKLIYQGKRNPKSYFFFGDRGVGKTLTARALSDTLKGRSVHFMASNIIDLDKKGSDSGKGIHDIFERARKHVELTEQWIIIFIDDIHDFQFIGGGQTPNMKSAITALRYEIAEERNNRKIIVIVATNQAKDKVDGFFTTTDYFDEISFPLPSKENGLAILKYYFSICGHKIKKGVTFDRMAKASEGFSVRKLIKIVDKVNDAAIRDGNKPIDYKHINEALNSYGRKLPDTWLLTGYKIIWIGLATGGGASAGSIAGPAGTVAGGTAVLTKGINDFLIRDRSIYVEK